MPFKYKKISFRPVVTVISFLLMIESLLMAIGILFALYYHEDSWPLAISAFITFCTGFFCWLPNRSLNTDISKNEGFLIVTLSWIIISLFGMLPYLFSVEFTSLTDAFFESMSGFTTTGSTILTDVELVPKNILFWRSMTQWIGGMGIVMLTLAILPILGIASFQLFAAEMTGPNKNKLHPKIKVTAKRLWAAYLLFTFLQIILLWCKDMNFFEAISHSLSTMSTGGFSTRNDGIASFSAYTQYVIAIFMMIGGINFVIFYYLVKRMFRKILDYHEFWVYLGIIVASTLIITIGIKGYLDLPLEKSFREALFNTISILTTSGFITTDFMQWPAALIMLIFFLMLIGGMAGSTSGGIKVVRQCLLIKNSYLELKRLIHPNAVIPLTFSKKYIDNNTMHKVMAFFVLYILVSFFFILIMSFMGLDFESSIGAVVTSIGNIGSGFGTHGHLGNFSALSNIGKWILTFVMLLGRLEIFTVLVILTPKFWKN